MLRNSTLDAVRNKHALQIASLLLSMDTQDRFRMGEDLQKIIRRFCEKHLPLTAGLRINNNELLSVVMAENFPRATQCINIATKHARDVISQTKVCKAHLLVVYVNPPTGKCEDLELSLNFVAA